MEKITSPRYIGKMIINDTEFESYDFKFGKSTCYIGVNKNIWYHLYPQFNGFMKVNDEANLEMSKYHSNQKRINKLNRILK